MNFVRFDPQTGRIHGWGYMLPAHVRTEREEKGGILLLDNFEGHEPVGLKVDLATETLVADDPPAPAAAPQWQRGNSRLLSIADSDAIRAVVLSRKKLWTAEDLKPYDFAACFDNPDYYVGKDVLGYYNDGVLDGVMVLAYPHLMGFEGEPCAVNTMNITMARANRAKENGWDVVNTAQILAMYDFLDHRTIWSHYHLISAKWSMHAENPALVGERFTRETIETIPAGQRAAGPHRAFINRFVAPKTFAEDTVVRVTHRRPETQ